MTYLNRENYETMKKISIWQGLRGKEARVSRVQKIWGAEKLFYVIL
jgi:hypothetical protein